MALNQVVIPTKKQVFQEGDSGGGMFGSLLGAVIGAVGVIAAAPTGGASLAAVAAAAGSGAAVGGVVGGAVDQATPGKMVDATPKPTVSETNPLKRRFDDKNAGQTDASQLDPSQQDVPRASDVSPEEQAQNKQHLEDALVAVSGSGVPDDVKQKAGPTLLKAYSMALKQSGGA